MYSNKTIMNISNVSKINQEKGGGHRGLWEGCDSSSHVQVRNFHPLNKNQCQKVPLPKSFLYSGVRHSRTLTLVTQQCTVNSVPSFETFPQLYDSTKLAALLVFISGRTFVKPIQIKYNAFPITNALSNVSFFLFLLSKYVVPDMPQRMSQTCPRW